MQLIPPVIPYIDGSRPVRPFSFPLSPDHQLITLIQYNLLRGMLTNMAIVSILDTIPAECGAVFTIPPSLLFEAPASPPPGLRATPLQKSTAHPLWIDAMPDPAMRDNLIRYIGAFDPDDLCTDLVGGLFDGYDDVEKRGLIIWSDPWRIESLEISEGFARKWSFLLRGCRRMMEATNHWREMRGEDRLVVEI